MKKVKEEFYNIPELKTLKEIIQYGTDKGKDKKQFIYLDKNEVEHTKSFNDVMRDICGLGTYMFLHGVKGKKVALLSENSFDWILVYYSTIYGGNVSVPLDSLLSAEDLTEELINCSCDVMFYSSKYAEKAEQIKAAKGTTITQYFCIDSIPEYQKEGWAAFDAGNRSLVEAEVQPSDLACIVYTSGTTGKSKGVMLSHGNIASDAVASCRVMHGKHAIGFLPLNHTFSWVSALYSGYILAEYGYICNGLKNIQRDIETYQPQNFAAVPLVIETIYDRIWKTAEKTGQADILKKGIKISRFLMKLGIDRRRKIFKKIIDRLGGNLEMIVCGGAALDPIYEQGMYDIGIFIAMGYGITECSPAVCCNRVNNFKIGSVGLPLPCNEIKINMPDADGVGEIYVRGTNVMQGYYNDPVATAEAFDGEWFKTGDYGRMDEDGFLYFVGRKKNLIVLGNGKNVSPEELEVKLLQKYHYIKEILVYEEDKRIVAEMFLNEEEYPDARSMIKDDVRAFNSSVPTWKKINKFKIRDEEFPKTTTLKIRRNYDDN